MEAYLKICYCDQSADFRWRSNFCYKESRSKAIVIHIVIQMLKMEFDG